MTQKNVLETLAGILNGDGGREYGGRKSDVKTPDEIFTVPGTEGDPLQIGIFRATHRRTGERTLFFDPRRMKDGRPLKTMRIQQLPALILGLFTLARGASREEEWVDPTTRARLAFLADQLEAVVTAGEQQLANGAGAEAPKKSLFDTAA